MKTNHTRSTKTNGAKKANVVFEKTMIKLGNEILSLMQTKIILRKLQKKMDGLQAATISNPSNLIIHE